jgi:hypothetical protein
MSSKHCRSPSSRLEKCTTAVFKFARLFRSEWFYRTGDLKLTLISSLKPRPLSHKLLKILDLLNQPYESRKNCTYVQLSYFCESNKIGLFFSITFRRSRKTRINHFYNNTSLFPRRCPGMYLSQSYSHMCTNSGWNRAPRRYILNNNLYAPWRYITHSSADLHTVTSSH